MLFDGKGGNQLDVLEINKSFKSRISSAKRKIERCNHEIKS